MSEIKKNLFFTIEVNKANSRKHFTDYYCLRKFAADSNKDPENDSPSSTASSNIGSADLINKEEKEILADIKRAELDKSNTESESIDGEKIKGEVEAA